MIKKFFFILIVIILPVISCHKEELKKDKPSGRLKIEIGLYISVNQENENLKSASGADDLRVIIYNSADGVVKTFEKASDIPDLIELETGSYYVTAFSENNLPAVFENPYYYGKSEVFSITPENQQTVVVNCELANTIVSVIYSDNIKNYFIDYTTTVSSAEGSLTYGKNETRSGYFRPLPLTITANLTWQKQDGTSETKILTGTIPDPKPKRKYEIHVNAAAGGGSSNLQVNLDESSGPVEIVNVSDEEQDADSVLKNGDLLITEVMYDPTAVADATGEWFEIYNNTNHSLNLKNLVIKKNETERHIITGSIILPSKNYTVLARSENAVSGTKYVYGTGITLNNTGAILSISNFGTDGTDGTAVCTLNYGEEGFPSASGASISLDPGMLNVADAQSGASWCVATSAYSSGDKGTPGIINDNCK